MNSDEEKELHWIVDILTYPFRGSGKTILLILTIMSVVSDILKFAPLIGLIAGLILFAYFCAIYMNLINSSACGEEEAPTFPEITNIFEDVILPTLQLLMTLAFSFLPLIIYLILAARADLLNQDIIYSLIVFGIIYFPMALLAVTILGHIGAISPHIVLPSLIKGLPHYLIAIFLLLGVLALQITLNLLLGAIESIPWIVTYTLLSLIGSYTLMANARTLGLVFREREDELAWI